MYVYYKEFQSEEHFLYAEELISLFDLNVTTQKLQKSIISYCVKNQIEQERIFYKRRYGLKRVYSVELAKKAIEYFDLK